MKNREQNTIYCRVWRNKNREKIRAYNREYNKQWRKENGYLNENYSKVKFYWKTLARNKLNNAVRNGIVVKRPCEFCGSVNAQAHHEDYSKPLEVRWLCPVHHREIHPHEAKTEEDIEKERRKVLEIIEQKKAEKKKTETFWDKEWEKWKPALR